MKKVLQGLIALASVSLAWSGPVDQSMDKILTDYFKIQSALAQDTTSGVDAAAKSILQTASSVDSSNAEVQGLVRDIRVAAQGIQGKELEAARSDFFALSQPLLVYLNKFHSDRSPYFRYYCPMAKKGWIQSEKRTRNPYYGSSMLACGNLIE